MLTAAPWLQCCALRLLSGALPGRSLGWRGPSPVCSRYMCPPHRRCVSACAGGGEDGGVALSAEQSSVQQRRLAVERTALPPVDYTQLGGETLSAAGRVITAQANFMRVLVRWEDLTAAQRAARQAQLEAARRAAEEAGAYDDVQLLTTRLAYEGPLEVLCVVRALLKKMQRRILVGDWVALSGVEWTAQRAMVAQLLQRTGQTLSDPPVANAQQLILCFAVNDPPVEAVQLTRFLVSAEASGVPFVLVFNKADLDTEQRRELVAERLGEWGYTGETAPQFVSVATGEGLPQLVDILRDRVTVIAGPSGVGKSSLINALRGVDGAAAVSAGDLVGAGGANKGRHATSGGGGVRDWQVAEDVEAELELDDLAAEAADGDAAATASPFFELQSVKSVSDRSRRGKHTTRHVSLLRLPGGGLLADTPGFSLPGLEHVTSRILADCFPEARAALEARTCAFSDCTHRDEPGCAVVGDPPWGRYPLYLELFEELAAREAAQARTSGRREPGLRTKARRGDGAAPRVEVKLTPHKHRRTSRTNANAATMKKLNTALVEQQDEGDGV